MMLSLLFIILACMEFCVSNNYASENTIDDDFGEEEENSSDNSYSKKSSSDKENSTKMGFYSGFSLSLRNNTLSGKLTSISTPENKTSEIKNDKNNLGVNFSLGYDKNFGSFIIGGGSTIGCNTGSSMEYSKQFKVAEIKLGNEYSAFAKIGLEVGNRVMLYGKAGCGVLSFNYDWKLSNPPNRKKDYVLFPLYGLGFECYVSKNVSLNAEYSASAKRDQDTLNISNNENKIQNSSSRVWQIKMGCNYRF